MKVSNLSFEYFGTNKNGLGRFFSAFIGMLILFCLCGNHSKANEKDDPVLKLRPIRDGIDLNDYLLLFKDESRSLSFEAVKDAEFTLNNQSNISLGYTKDADWIKFSVYNPGYYPRQVVLKFDKILVDSLSLYYYSKIRGEWQEMHGGAEVPMHQKPILGLNTYFPVRLLPNDTTTLYLRCVSTYGKNFAVSLINNPVLHNSDVVTSLYIGLYIGILLCITLYNVFVGYSINDKLYLHYALANLFTLLGGLGNMGFYAYYMPANLLELVPYLTSTLVGLCIVFNSSFNIRILELKKYSRFAYFLMSGVAYFSLLGIIIINIQKYLGTPVHYSFVAISCLLFSVTAIVAGIIAWRKGTKYARFYVYGWSAALLGLFLLTLTLIGYIPKNSFTSNFYAVGAALEVLLMSFALADRYGFIQKEKNKLELELQYKNSDLTKVVTDNRIRHSFKKNVVNQLKVIQLKDIELVKKELGSFITDLNIQIEADEKRNRLQQNIDKINTEFEKKLKERFPRLTKSEIEVCAYLKLNLSVKEIASLRKTSETTVKVTKHRINKKVQEETGSSINEILYEV